MASRGAGGSHVLAMRWVHDLDAFDALPSEEQENVFGRTKPDSIEFVGAAAADRPPTSRASQIEDDAGEELPIYRRSVPYGTDRSSTASTSLPSPPTAPGSTGCWRACSAPTTTASTTG